MWQFWCRPRTSVMASVTALSLGSETLGLEGFTLSLEIWCPGPLGPPHWLIGSSFSFMVSVSSCSDHCTPGACLDHIWRAWVHSGAPRRSRMPGAASITRAQESVPTDWQRIPADRWDQQAVCCYARLSPCALPGVPRLPTFPNYSSSCRGALSLRTRKPGLGLEILNGATSCRNPFQGQWGLGSGCPAVVSACTEVAAVDARWCVANT